LRIDPDGGDGPAVKTPKEPTPDELIERLYGAPFESQLWQGWLEDMIKVLRAHSGQIQLLDHASGTGDWVAIQGHCDRGMAAYDQHFWDYDIVAKRALQVPQFRAVASHEVVSDKEYLNSSFYNDFCKPYLNNTFRIIGSVFELQESTRVTLGFHRKDDAGPFSPEESALITSLIPHLRRALLIRSRLMDARRRLSATQAALDRIRYGVLILSRRFEVVLTNKYAEAILKRRDGLSMDRFGRLCAESHRETEAIAAAILRCKDSRTAVALRVSRPSGSPDYELLLSPIPSRPPAEMFEHGSVAVFLRDPQHVPAPQASILNGLYDLSAAEADVAIALARGLSLQEIAAKSGRGIETVRSHLRSIFQKTGTSRQSELVGLLTAIGGFAES
jgi:DNA-binding CsgD family transcriptional regulator